MSPATTPIGAQVDPADALLPDESQTTRRVGMAPTQLPRTAIFSLACDGGRQDDATAAGTRAQASPLLRLLPQLPQRGHRAAIEADRLAKDGDPTLLGRS